LRSRLAGEVSQLRAETERPKLFASASPMVEGQLPDSPDLQKWFTEQRAKELAVIKAVLRELSADEYKEFFVLAFLAIIRRVSNAYDGEVRPHVNPDKKPRPAFEA